MPLVRHVRGEVGEHDEHRANAQDLGRAVEIVIADVVLGLR